MPAAIGPLGPLLADPARARREPIESGGGSAFARILETDGQSDEASREKDGERSGGTGSAAVLALSSQSPAPVEDTAPKTDQADIEQLKETSDLVAVAPAPTTSEAAASTSEEEVNIKPAALPDAQATPAGHVKVDDAAGKNAASLDTPNTARPAAEARPEGKPVQAEIMPADAAGSTPETEVINAAPGSDGLVRGAVTDQQTSRDVLTSGAAAQHAEPAEGERSQAAELKSDKAAISDATINARTEIRGSEAPGRPDLVLASLTPGAQPSERATGRLKDVPATIAPATVGPAQIDPETTPRIERGNMQPAITTSQLAAESAAESSAFLSGGLEVSAQATGSGDNGQQAPVLSVAAGAPAPAPVAAQAPANAPAFGAMMTPAQAMIVAAPLDIVDLMSNKLAGGDKPDRIMVQLDPPELGRVSIEFKFDAQGLQQVAVRADTPEAMKQLRLLHFDLVQSLEQHGLSARDMTFSEGSANGSQNQQPANFIDYTAVADNEAETMPPPALLQPHRAPITIGASGLNIKL